MRLPPAGIDPPSAFYAYDPETRTWTAIEPAQRVPVAAMGDLILLEGFDGSRQTHHVFDTTRRETHDIVIGPEVGSVTYLPRTNTIWTGTLLVMSGILYDPLTERWGLALGTGISEGSFIGPAFGGSLWHHQANGSTSTLSVLTLPEHLLRACP